MAVVIHNAAPSILVKAVVGLGLGVLSLFFFSLFCGMLYLWMRGLWALAKAGKEQVDSQGQKLRSKKGFLPVNEVHDTTKLGN